MNVSSEQTVFVVDDDASVREIVAAVCRSRHLAVETFDSAEAFLDAYRSGRRGCLLVDIRMPGLDGISLYHGLKARGFDLPTIVITSHATVKLAVEGLKQGIADFIEKPIDNELLLSVIQRVLSEDVKVGRAQADREAVRVRFAMLTPREREVMQLLTAGATNKIIASKLGISVRTVELHRARVMTKSRARTVADLVRMALAVEKDGSAD